MDFRDKTGSKGMVVTRNPYGTSIHISDQNPETRYLPPDPRERAEAFRRADTLAEMPPAPKR